MTREELILKTKTAKSAEELLALAKENDIAMDEESAKAYFDQINKAGELADDELDNVSGGACHTSVNGEKYTVVTSGLDCFTGYYEDNSYYVEATNGYETRTIVEHHSRDNWQLRGFWEMCSLKGQCGHCRYLAFKDGTGYCSKS